MGQTQVHPLLREAQKVGYRKSSIQNASQLSESHSDTLIILGGEWLSALAALLHSGRRRDDEPRHLFACARSRTVERRLCRAVRATG